ncbi:HNHc domain containing protein [uncultured Caudovirales phage]|uniref:HNHc domain containing protein n=1 Tax=uncultured Caudovirales phage TaxID=2100421 RepID=A0A6J5QIJ4_9CAUD|nr:HNHc domain containing protein [uncultured Caudovirales phage]CAB4184163.1 HNHc domain containing protein [uncultured Caudovirales phage]CAB4203366.1 HNHc domain containing protein [uncultured Caudovirales phage]
MAIKKGQLDCFLNCSFCDKKFEIVQYAQRFCSYKCGYSYGNRERQKIANSIPRQVQCCQRCNADLSLKKSHAIYCSKKCKSMDHTAKHRAKTRTSSIARRLDIYKRDDGKCYMCNGSISLGEVELDHIIPVALGGSSDSSNIAASCRQCNRKKGTKVGEVQMTKLRRLQK